VNVFSSGTAARRLARIVAASPRRSYPFFIGSSRGGLLLFACARLFCPACAPWRAFSAARGLGSVTIRRWPSARRARASKTRAVAKTHLHFGADSLALPAKKRHQRRQLARFGFQRRPRRKRHYGGMAALKAFFYAQFIAKMLYIPSGSRAPAKASSARLSGSLGTHLRRHARHLAASAYLRDSSGGSLRWCRLLRQRSAMRAFGVGARWHQYFRHLT